MADRLGRTAPKRQCPGRGARASRNSDFFQRDQLRRSATQSPEQAPLPPLQEPLPALPASLPVPVAVLSPVLTLTTSDPSLPTLPLIVTLAWPAFITWPLLMRIG